MSTPNEANQYTAVTRANEANALACEANASERVDAVPHEDHL